MLKYVRGSMKRIGTYCNILSVKDAYNRTAHVLSALYIISLLFMAIILLPHKAHAFSSGDGSSQSPYQVSNCTELQEVGSVQNTDGMMFELTGDINCSATSSWNAGAGFNPIDGFEGVFDGKGFTISGLTINRPAEDEVGLFSNAYNAYIYNVSLDDTSLIRGRENVGSIAGNFGDSKMSGVSSVATVEGQDYVGGLVGIAGGWDGSMVIQRSTSGATVNILPGLGGYAGGVLGFGSTDYRLYDLDSTATVTGTKVGGLIGLSSYACGDREILRTQVSGTITGSVYTGGLVGEFSGQTCFSTTLSDNISQATLAGDGVKGGIIGRLYNTPLTTTSTIFNGMASGTQDCAGTVSGGNGAPTCTVDGWGSPPDGEPYDAWNFDTVWQTGEGGPYLRTPVSTPDGPDAVSNLQAEVIHRNGVQLSWVAGSTGDFPLGWYTYQIKEHGDSWDQIIDSNTTYDTTITSDNLKLATQYDARVRVYTTFSVSEWVEVSFTTEEAQVYTIDTCEELQSIDNDANSYLDTFRLAQDIDCSGIEDFTPLSWDRGEDGNYFAGIFEGQGHTISNLTITTPTDYYSQGLFVSLDQATVRNVNLEGVNINLEAYYVGALAGVAYDSELTNIHVGGESSVTGLSYVGGIVGEINSGDTDVTVSNLSFTGSVLASEVEGGYIAGGLFGYVNVDNNQEMIVEKSYASGSVTLNGNQGGGLIGEAYVENDNSEIFPAQLIIRNSFANSDVSGANSIGGLIGHAETYNDEYENEANIIIENAYATGTLIASGESAGGLIGYVYDLEYPLQSLQIRNAFATTAFITNGGYYGLIGNSGFVDEGEFILENTYYDEIVAGTDLGIGDEVDGWTAINTEAEPAPDYFKGNSTNPPLNEWDFEDIWQVNEDALPTLKAVALTPEGEDAVDTDNDGISNDVENDAPNDGDANNDGTSDAEQANVASYVNEITGKNATLAVDEECTIESLATISEAATSNVADSGYDYPAGLMDFRIDCGTPGFTATVQQFYYDITGDFTVRKYIPNTGAYTNIPGATTEDQTIDGQAVKVAAYQITDGSDIDLDGTENGAIEDPAGLAQNVVNSPNTGFLKL